MIFSLRVVRMSSTLWKRSCDELLFRGRNGSRRERRRHLSGVALAALALLPSCGPSVSGSDQQVFVFTVPVGSSINLDLSSQKPASRLSDPFAPVPVPAGGSAMRGANAGGGYLDAAPRPASIDVTFAPGSAHLDASAKRELIALAVALRDPELDGARFLIAGHSDASGDLVRNRALSQERAEAVRAFLIDPGGVDPLRLIARGFGSDDPLDPSNPNDPANRRIEISRL